MNIPRQDRIVNEEVSMRNPYEAIRALREVRLLGVRASLGNLISMFNDFCDMGRDGYIPAQATEVESYIRQGRFYR